jgi:hypothetical protein
MCLYLRRAGAAVSVLLLLFAGVLLTLLLFSAGAL